MPQSQTLTVKDLTPKDIQQIVIYRQDVLDEEGQPTGDVKIQMGVKYRHHLQSDGSPLPFGSAAGTTFAQGTDAFLDVMSLINDHLLPWLATQDIVPPVAQ
jgi:hypothetical protein